MDSARRFPRMREWGIRLWTALLLFMLVALSVQFRDVNIEAYRHFPAGFAIINIPIVIAVFLMTRGLNSLHAVFTWQPSHLVFGKPEGEKAESLILTAMRVRFVGPLIIPLLIFNLPIIAMLEEFIFRLGTDDWTDAAVRSALFGLAHLTANVPLGACIAISGSGMWFSYWFFRGDIALSSTVHFAYIAVIIGLAIPAMIAQRFVKVR